MSECSVDVCTRLVWGNLEWCAQHYALVKRYGEPTPTKKCIGCIQNYQFVSHEVNGGKNGKGYCERCIKLKDKYFSSNLIAVLLCHHITMQDFISLWRSQKGCCKICGVNPGRPDEWPKRQGLQIEHDHSCHCGKTKGTSCGHCIRGLVCQSCNLMLGYYERHKGPLSIDIFDKYLAGERIIFPLVET